MDIKSLILSLHPLERTIFPHLEQKQTAAQLVSATGMSEPEVGRAIQWLEEKGIITTRTLLSEKVGLDENGKAYATKGLPEDILLRAIVGKPLSVEEGIAATGLLMQEIQASLGVLRQRGYISIGADKKLQVTPLGTQAARTPNLEDTFLRSLIGGERDMSALTDAEKHSLDALRKRRAIIIIRIEKTVTFTLTGLGKQALASGARWDNIIDSITPDMLASGLWKDKQFRSYDVSIPSPALHFGRRHHYRAFLDDVRKRFLALGFSEMGGPLVESDFWDMDALYMPQFHSARDIHQAYYVREPTYGTIDANALKRVKAAHENGGGTGSKGWRYEFDVERTRRLLLRTQGTACSARMLASKGLKVPGKYFGITRCFRYDVIDATHLPDFFQTEGIIVEEDLTFRHLKGMLRLFAEEFAKTSEVRIKPGYFPFTEPSCELYAKHPELGWIELGGAGIFRPELTHALGVDTPVIAWGLGIDRIGMFNMGIKDIRALYSNDLAFLRSIKVI
ncbi:phenylalanine--tRNA ligase subunit alpha [Candidatus Woesearchaeota archaeon]|nr:phenylalanine--tRNA ligase subunit alpha [Candidatus Woesearchaeota archaeon]